MQSISEIKITIRNPLDLKDQLTYYLDIENTDFHYRWVDALKKNLKQKLHLEKNYCWLGFADSDRNLVFLCEELRQSIEQINKFNQTNAWQNAGLKPFYIEKKFSASDIWYDPFVYTVGKNKTNDIKQAEHKGMCLRHDNLNLIHRYFEELQGNVVKISSYYKIADYDTKFAIRQLNNLCHEIENYVSAARRQIIEPEWQRPSQIVTFLNAPRYNLLDADYFLFFKNRYNRELGGVYLHWAQIGKTHYEVFRDESGKALDSATCSEITSLKYYSGEFDIEWGQDVLENDGHPWFTKELNEFKCWLKNNDVDYNDPKLSFGYIKLGQVNLEKSFGTRDFLKILKILSTHQDICKISVDGIEVNYPYVWSDKNYKKMQINLLKPGYDWSKYND